MEELAQPAGELRAALAQLSDTLAEIEPAPGTYAELGAAVRRLDDAFERMKAGWSAEDLSPADLLAVAERAGAFLDRARAELGQTGAALDRLAVDVRRLRDRMPPGLSDRLARTLDQARAAIAKVERVVASATELATRVRQGHGTVGALMNDPEFSDDAKQLGRLLKRNPWRILGHPTREALEKQ
jgi:hypothetical protein